VSLRTTTDWDAKTYDRLAAPQEEWARRVLERFSLDGTETVLDAGCGSGRVTKLLLDRLPHGRVIGVDGSPSMIETARESLAERGNRVRLLNSDLLQLSPDLLEAETGDRSVDVVFSNATFHWIADHDRLFEAIHSVLRPGGRLIAQCGGKGNVVEWVEAVRRAADQEPFAPHIGDFEPWNFAGPDETERRLADAGFQRVRCWLEETPPILPDDPREYVAVVGLAPHRERLPEELRERFIDAVIAELPRPPELRYIRLNIVGVSPR
jgi:trans-aconitate 2-methyltransferase